jgi:hypothetical protein
VPNKPGTQHRSVRISDEDWDDLEAATAAAGSDRGTLIKQFIRWYLRRPGAKLPERPTPAFWAARQREREDIPD